MKLPWLNKYERGRSDEKYVFPSDFDINIYRDFNNDIAHYDDAMLKLHFVNFGNREKRIYSLSTLLLKHHHLVYFDLNYYIQNNTDISFNTPYEYILDYIKNRLNDNRKISQRLTEFKRIKQEKLSDILVDPKEDFNWLGPVEKNEYKIGINQSESSNEWSEDSVIAKLINENELVLNIGAGYRRNADRYYMLDNVINTEIFAYPTTDIICDGGNLPFKDNSFDVVLSLAVLEHVKNPWVHADEMIRVLKPGGIVYADVPFLQPYHGYPHHYYNMTTAGLKNLFSKKIEIVSHTVPSWSKPIFTLTWFLSSYCDFLTDEQTVKTFKNLTVNEIIINGNDGKLDYVRNLDVSKEEIIASASTLIGKKTAYASK